MANRSRNRLARISEAEFTVNVQLHHVERCVSLVDRLDLPSASGAWEYIQEWQYFTKGINMPNNGSNWVTIIQTVPLPFPQNPPKSRGPSRRPTAFIRLRPGPKPSQAVT